MQRALWQARLLGRMLPHYLATAIPLLVLLAGLVGLVELAYSLLAGEGATAGDEATRVLGMQVHLRSAMPWATALAVSAAGAAGLYWIGGRMKKAWHQTLETLNGGRA
jgi:branched-chain amino acid transport system permease protein